MNRRSDRPTRRKMLNRLGAAITVPLVWSREQVLPTHGAEHRTDTSALSVMHGLKWLASQQTDDGGFGRLGTYSRNVGVCAFAGLAFLAHNGPRGKFASQVRGCTQYLLAHTRASGYIIEDDVVTHAPMYGHGFATLYLGQVCGSDLRLAVRETLSRATSLIVGAQGERGGWQYTPSPDDADVSISACQMLALVSAHQAGIGIPKTVIDKGVGFIRRCQNPDGGFRYRYNDPPDSLFPRSAAAVAALHAIGFHADPAVMRGRAYLAKPFSEPSVDKAEYYYYGRFHATYAAWQAGVESWDRWYPAVRDELVARQNSTGYWSDSNIGNVYATAMALLVLQLSLKNVPLFLL